MWLEGGESVRDNNWGEGRQERLSKAPMKNRDRIKRGNQQWGTKLCKVEARGDNKDLILFYI